MAASIKSQAQAGADEVDLMNDAAFDPDTGDDNKQGHREPDTCRICRGDGNLREPLFHPCKCSGSIKFVHQECLMEWLMHSQKKHCELCKTPFRFTKLYDPEMPPKLPLSIFSRHMAFHSLINLLTWSRFSLVSFVWLCWLPWSMRAVWRVLFWIGDGGWTAAQAMSASVRDTKSALVYSRQTLSDFNLKWNSTSSARPWLSLLNSVAVSKVVDTVASAWCRWIGCLPDPQGEDMPSLHALNSSFSLNGSMDSGFPISDPHRSDSQNSFLSEVKFLTDLTRFDKLNNTIVQTVEGQVITLAIVVALILIFLIREWVVQQQPGFNLEGIPDFDLLPREVDGDGQVAEADAEARALPAGQLELEQMENERRNGQGWRRNPADLRRRHLPERAGPDGEGDQGNGEGPRPDQARPMARVRRRVHFPPETQLQRVVTTQDASTQMEGTDSPNSDGQTESHHESGLVQGVVATGDENVVGKESTPQEPIRPARDDPSLPVHRTMEEGKLHNVDNYGMQHFLQIWLGAGMTQEDLIELVDADDSSAELTRVIDAIGAFKNPESRSDDVKEVNEAAIDLLALVSHNRTLKRVGGGEAFSGGHANAFRREQSPKGKGKAQEERNQGKINDEGAAAAGNHKREPIDPPGETASGAQSPQSPIDWTWDPAQFRFEEVPRIGYVNNPPSLVLGAGSEPTGPPSDSSSEFEEDLMESTGDGFFRPRILGQDPEAFDAELIQRLERRGGDADRRPLGNLRQPGWLERAVELLWGDMLPAQPEPDPIQENDEHIVQDLDDELPFVPVRLFGHRRGRQEVNPRRLDGDQEVVEDEEPENEAGGLGEDEQNDQDAVEDGEDFDGVMELIGMRGPLVGLFQNATFSAIIIAATICWCIWLPYIWGKIVILVLANPLIFLVQMPLRLVLSSADFLADLTLFFGGSFFYWTDQILRYFLAPLASVLPVVSKYSQSRIVADASRSIAERGLERTTRMIVAAAIGVTKTDYPDFSVLSYVALQTIKESVSTAGRSLIGTIATTLSPSAVKANSEALSEFIRQPLPHIIQVLSSQFVNLLGSIRTFATELSRLTITYLIPGNTVPRLLGDGTQMAFDNREDCQWTTMDRVIAIVCGYAFFTCMGALYLSRKRPFSTSEPGRKIEGIIADVLHQAGGVLKVILIISIEMIAFPLYCGLLLDIALLPLFDKATILSRVDFMLDSPCTSVFVHWFVGTCYMFHFALFVSMCRKIMRKGVLYFIRDPDDPTFHPVRDVLERNVTTQLRKITFSALVYGALVMVCLGGVVWGISWVWKDILPIHWSSNEPVLEFPVDLLFYNFLAPAAVRVFKPSQGLRSIYTWWFRRCARALRLSSFLFGERKDDEEGRHVRRTLWDTLSGKVGDVTKPIIGRDRQILAEDRKLDVYFLRDGRYVRAPASDQVRIPRGDNVFEELDKDGKPLDGSIEEESDQNDMNFTKVYIPPWFSLRIGVFIFLIWIFAAVTGVGITLVPLVFGRRLFAILNPEHPRMNDLYAFSIGVYALGGILYACLHYAEYVTWAKQHLNLASMTRGQFLPTVFTSSKRLASIVYVTSAFCFLLPSLLALLMELYVLIPLHTFFAPHDKHTVHFVQDWTLGVLFFRLALICLLRYPDTRPARAIRAVARDGFLNPNVRVATRCFIAPVTALMGAALVLPLPLGGVVNKRYYSDAPAMVRVQVYRYCYPAVLALVGWMGLMYSFTVVVRKWKLAIRDEHYLIGERLHNFGERQASGKVVTRQVREDK